MILARQPRRLSLIVDCQPPIPNFSLTDDDFTELRASVQQSFLPGDTLRHRGEQTTALAGAEDARRAEQARNVLREVRYWWLAVYDQTEAARLTRENQKLFSQIAKITQSQYGAGFGTQQDVLSAQLEVGLLKDREAEFDAKRNEALAELAKWLGPESAVRPLAEDWPALPALPERAEIEAQLDNHPAILVEDAMINAGQSGVDLARDQYKPAWGVDVGYGLRGAGRSDFLSAMVTLDLPIFTDKRQDKRLAASQQETNAARYARDDRRRELHAMLDTQYAVWTGFTERLALNEKQLLPQAQQTAEAALNAYQSNVTDFPTMMRARITALETRLAALRLRVQRAQTQAKLLYLAGE